MNRSNIRLGATVTITALLFAIVPLGAVAAEEDPTNAGGLVNNILPATTLLNLEGATARVGVRDVLSGTITDNNGEQDLTTIRIKLNDDVLSTFDMAGLNLATDTTRPTDATNGWRVWNPSGAVRTGSISFEFEYEYGAAGLFEFALDASDGTFGDAATRIVDVRDALTFSPPTDENGDPLEGERWGGWIANPGASNVETANFFKAVNNGDDPTQAFDIHFTDETFGGLLDLTWGIDIYNNIQFACVETQTDEAPGVLFQNAVWSATSVDGIATCAFTAGSELGVGTIYAKYRIVDIPVPMAAQDYAASYTVTADIS